MIIKRVFESLAQYMITEHYFQYDTVWQSIENEYNKPDRYYHNLNHIKKVMEHIKTYLFKLSREDIDALNLAAIFHDIYYKAGDPLNEQKSLDFMLTYCAENDPVVIKAKEIILQTAKAEVPTDKLCKIFFEADWSILKDSNKEELIEYEHQISKEFQKFDYATYKEKRIQFLYKAYNLFPNENILELIEYVQHRVIKIGVYAGSFNPLTIAHHSIIMEAEKIFDKVIVACGVNTEKHNDSIDTGWEERLPNKIIKYSTMTHELLDTISKTEGCDVVLIRGLRNGSDLEYEQNFLKFLKDMSPNLKYVLLFGDMTLSHISSSAVRGIYKMDKELAKKYIY